MTRRDERGSFTLWVLGLCMILLMVGGVSIDLWRAFAARRSLAAMADAAAVAGASALDESAFRDSGAVQLQLTNESGGGPTAYDRANANLDAQSDRDEVVGRPDIQADEERIRVTLAGEIDFTLVRLFAGGDSFTINVTATAEPRRLE